MYRADPWTIGDWVYSPLPLEFCGYKIGNAYSRWGGKSLSSTSGGSSIEDQQFWLHKGMITLGVSEEQSLDLDRTRWVIVQRNGSRMRCPVGIIVDQLPLVGDDLATIGSKARRGFPWGKLGKSERSFHTEYGIRVMLAESGQALHVVYARKFTGIRNLPGSQLFLDENCFGHLYEDSELEEIQEANLICDHRRERKLGFDFFCRDQCPNISSCSATSVENAWGDDAWYSF
ncbi:hypothetical protein Tco_0017471 [Tanacetum coccineum]